MILKDKVVHEKGPCREIQPSRGCQPAADIALADAGGETLAVQPGTGSCGLSQQFAAVADARAGGSAEGDHRLCR